MTTQGTELTGARVTDADGQVVGTVEQVFNDDADGTPVWARVRAGKVSRFVPLAGRRTAGDGFSVPFETKKIMSGPDMGVERHMSAEQADELRHYYGLMIPAQTGQPGQSGQAGQPGQAGQVEGQTRQAEAGAPSSDEWLVRTEERMAVGTEVLESGRVRLRKYVDVEPVEQAIHVFHEEYELERVPITAEERVRGPIAEGNQEIVLHEERAVIKKEAVPVERVRLVAKKVAEDRTIRDELRKERIEVEADGGPPAPGPGELPEQNQRRPLLGRNRNPA